MSRHTYPHIQEHRERILNTAELLLRVKGAEKKLSTTVEVVKMQRT